MKTYPKLVLVIAVIITLFSCSKKTPEQKIHEVVASKANFQVNQFILDKFKDHRIVMLADNERLESAYLRQLTSFLDYWNDDARNDKDAPRKLVVVVEHDSIEAGMILKYAKSRNLQDLIGKYPYYVLFNTTSELENYWRIGDLLKPSSVSDPNAKGLKLDILGPEMVIDPDTWTVAKRDSFFINSRDTISANVVINYLIANPDNKALIFYSGPHLVKDKTSKPLNSGSVEGYYMALYLYEKFGDQLYCINQLPVGFLQDSRAFFGPDSSYAIENKYIGNFLDSYNNKFDATIFFEGYSEPTINLQIVKSKSLGWLELNYLKDYYSQKDVHPSKWSNWAAEYLSILTGQMDFLDDTSTPKLIKSNIPIWEKWLNDSKVDVVTEITSLAINQRLLNLVKTSSDTSVACHSAFLFTLITGQEWGYNMSLAQREKEQFIQKFHAENADDRALRIDDYEYFLQHNENLLIVTDLVQLLWVGTDQEKQEALAELQKRTGQTYTTAPDWMKWWRENYKKL
jgi:hypothetical protein